MTSLPSSLPDFSEYLKNPYYLALEEAEWALHAEYMKNADLLKEALVQTECKTVLEVGCGSGWIPLRLQWPVLDYLGVDNNDGCLELCHNKNPGIPFVKCDVRVLPEPYTADMVCAFAFFKHFGLHEWDSVIASILRRGHHAVFTMQIADTDFDDGTEYPHVWVTDEHLTRVAESVGHRIVEQKNAREAAKGIEWTFVTRKYEYE